MTLEGEFAPSTSKPLMDRVLVWAIVVAVIASAAALAAFALWLALLILPFAAGAVLIAYGLFRYRLWQAQKAYGQQQGVWRP